ncbi:hypothetical protein JVT61DRAFT_11436 [Boletus reticuloceps]|uniref:Uncharacterized protein n=1 Tax=Boletus reticuloceps TaxID=495285 RepID=A0A8I2YTI1_9AGAM|nr:hypothetical protein JVT61DRAFT_11436 [Boletus reticuloceps]
MSVFTDSPGHAIVLQNFFVYCCLLPWFMARCHSIAFSRHPAMPLQVLSKTVYVSDSISIEQTA